MQQSMHPKFTVDYPDERQRNSNPTTAPPAYTNNVSPSNSGSEESPTPPLSQEEIQEVDKTLDWIPNPPPAPNYAYPRLQKPILIPQLDISPPLRPPLPFTRAYAPILTHYSINEKDFLSFLDNLTIATSPSPPFQVLNIAGMGVGMVPHHWAQAASLGIGIAAGAGTAAVAYARTKRYLEGVNRGFFAPRGLKVMLVKDKMLGEILGESMEGLGLAPRHDCTKNGRDMSLRDRRLKILEPFIAELKFDVPPPAEQKNVLDRIAAKQVNRKISKHETKQIEEEEKKLKEREKHLRKAAKNSDSSVSDIGFDMGADDSDASSIISLNKEIRSLERKIEKIDQKADEKRMKTEKPKKLSEIEGKRIEEIEKVEKEIRKTERDLEKKHEKWGRKAGKRQDKEIGKVGKLRWIVIKNL